MIIEFRHTDLPQLVAPAISMCGILVRSAHFGWPAMSLPSTKASLEGADRKSWRSSTSRKRTRCTFLLGTSMPTTFLPGTGASIRTAIADSAARHIAVEVGNRRDAHARRRLHFVARDHRAAFDIGHARINFEEASVSCTALTPA